MAEPHWVPVPVGIPSDVHPKLVDLARRKGLKLSPFIRTLCIAALEADRAA